MYFRQFGALLLAVGLCSTSLAAADDVPADVAARIRATLHERIPDLKVEGVHKSPVPGLYELDNRLKAYAAAGTCNYNIHLPPNRPEGEIDNVSQDSIRPEAKLSIKYHTTNFCSTGCFIK